MSRPETSLAGEPLLAGRYAHVAELGRGASGRVLLVEDRALGGTRAVKIVPAEEAERLRWELTLLASLAHPGLARVYELITVREPLGAPFRLEPGAAALVEEHVDGASAGEVARGLASDEERVRFAVEVGIAVARALGAMHAAGLVHGDVKPTNVVVPAEPSAAKLVDLGLARPAGVSSTVSGTPAFLAPEAWLGERSVATDLYALGVTLHALVSGGGALETLGSTESLARALMERPSASSLPLGAPTPLRRLIGDLLADEPGLRPASAREVALRLAALAPEVGASAPEGLAISETPSAIERAARATLRPLVGRREALGRLVERLREPGVVVLGGPPGAGRSRLVREAARAIQNESAAKGERVPTYVAAPGGRVPRLAHDAIVHLKACSLELEGWRAQVDAAAVEGLRLVVVAEPAQEPEEADLTLGPLDEAGLERLLRELLEVDPAPSLVAAARAASGGLPGRLCRLVADGLEEGLEPSRPGVLEELGRQAEGGTAIPAAARPLAELLAAAGGALDAVVAQRVLPNAAERARLLRARGLAHDAGGRVALRADLARSLALDPERRRTLATALADEKLDALAEGHVRASLGDEEEAVGAFLRAMEEARRRGDPEGAAAIGIDAGARIGTRLSLALATADALRACAREKEAAALLEEVEGPEARALRAELLRLLGDAEGAQREAERAGTNAAPVLARLSLDRGDVEGARALTERAEDSPNAARLLEVRVFAELSLGRIEEALRAAERALALAERSGSRALEARALGTLGVALGAKGRIDEAAARYERAFELADQAGERHAAASFLVNVGLGRLERGEAGPAIEALREGARRLTALGRRGDAARALYNLGNAAALVGDDDLARDAIRRAVAWAGSDPSAAALAEVVESELLLRAGKLEQAEQALERGWRAPRVFEPVRATLGARLAIVRAIRGRLEAAEELLEQLSERSEDVELAIARARVALAHGDHDEAVERAQVARSKARGWESRLRAELILAEALERAGRGAEALLSLAEARGLLDRAAASLPALARSRLRAVPAYQKALGAAPEEPATSVDSRWRALAKHARSLVRERRISRLHEQIVDAAVELVDAERGFLVARAADGSTRILAARAFGGPLEGERPSESIAAQVLDQGRAIVAVDALDDPHLARAASVHAMALRSVAAVPLPLRQGRAMALVLDDRLRPGAFDRASVELLTDLAELSAGALEGAEALRRERRAGRRLTREKERMSEQLEVQARELGELRRRADGGAFARIVGDSEPMRRAIELASRVAASDAPVLVRGESGTGKELFARAVHDASPRRDGPYVSENVSAIPEALLESTLFGHVRGAFTGAERPRRGLFEIADGGTLFLDEIGEMSEPMQAKLLRVLQDGQLRPVGSEETRRVDVRLVTATHRDLEAMVADGRFREDLFYRIAVVQLPLPSLRERPEDIAALVHAFLERHAPGRAVRLDRAAMKALRRYAWPGNVRQLENEVRRALVLADDVIGVEHLSPAVLGEMDEFELDELDLKGQVGALERRLIRAALERTNGNQTRAAELLGVSRFGLAKMMKRLGLRV